NFPLIGSVFICTETYMTVIRKIEETGPESGHLEILQNFADAINKGIPLLALGEEGILGLSIANAAYLSSEKDCSVSIPFPDEEYEALLKELQMKEHVWKKEKEKEVPSGKYSDRWSVRW
ncbi:MAG: gfo/Idh/MocA family oxidoreductase, partial [Clostridiales bacterium]|nr:gfo/Idh/MocA family oxidoreductase [Clostridiales bacterium]